MKPKKRIEPMKASAIAKRARRLVSEFSSAMTLATAEPRNEAINMRMVVWLRETIGIMASTPVKMRKSSKSAVGIAQSNGCSLLILYTAESILPFMLRGRVGET